MRCVRQLGAHPARCLVLLPYAQLGATAKTMWARARHANPELPPFVPRFATALHWAQSLPPAEHSGPDSIRFDAARDGLAARAMLNRAGLDTHAAALAHRLVSAAHEIARRVAALPPR